MTLNDSGLRAGGLRRSSVGVSAIPDSVDNQWDADEGTDTTLNNAIGTETITLNNGGSWVTGSQYVGDTAPTYDRADNDYWDGASIAINDTNASFCFWYYHDSSDTSPSMFQTSTADDPFPDNGWRLGDGTITGCENGDNTTATFLSDGFVSGSRYFLAFAWDGDTVDIYIWEDGTQIVNRTDTLARGTTTNDVPISGMGRTDSDRYFTGEWDATYASTTDTLTEAEFDELRQKRTEAVTDGGVDSSTIETRITLDTSAPKSKAISGDYSYVTGEGFSSVDISDPTAPNEVATLPDTETQGYGIAIDGNYAFVSQLDGEFKTIDINDPTSPSVVATLSYTSGLRKVTVDGSHAYVSTNDDGDDFYTIDISDPTNPVKADSLTDADFAGRCFEVGIKDSTAIVCNRDDALLVSVDISDPENLTKSAAFSDANVSGPYGIDFSGDTAFVTDPETADQLVSLDATDPSNLSLISTFSSSDTNHPYGIDIYSGYAVLACRDSNTVTTIDISDPANMSQVGVISTGSANFGPYDSAVSGEYTFSITRTNAEFIVSGTE